MQIINAWLNGDDEDTQKQETTRGGSWNNSKKKDDDSPDAISSKYSSLDDAFADLESL